MKARSRRRSAEADTVQELLDGLPIAAAELGRGPDEAVLILRANDQFRALAGYDERLRGAAASNVALFSDPSIAASLGRADPVQFDTVVGGLQLQVRLAPLGGAPTAADRNLLTLIDRSAEIAPVHGFALAPLRDPLTGLPDRRGFEERVREVLEHPNFEDGRHALLTVRLPVAHDAPAAELLLAAARRLLSALRAGDLLARTGPASFAMLVRLEPDQPDVPELVERLRRVLAASFRLSDCELDLTASIECARLSRAVQPSRSASST